MRSTTAGPSSARRFRILSTATSPAAFFIPATGQGRCNCLFSNAYPYSIAPRLGVAYQIDSKTVFRGGAGVTYAPISTFAYITNAAILGVGFNLLNFPSPAFGVAGDESEPGFAVQPVRANHRVAAPGLYSNASGTPSSAPFYIDPNAGRAPRILQWSFGLQRQVAKDIVVESNFVGNRGAWLNSSTFDGGLNTSTRRPSQKYGIDPTTAAGQATLAATIGSAAGQSLRRTAALSYVPAHPDRSSGSAALPAELQQ